MKRLIQYILACTYIGLWTLSAAPADDRHRCNPDSDGRPPNSVYSNQYYVPRVGESIDDPRLRFTGSGDKKFTLGRATCIGYAVDADTLREKTTDSYPYNAKVFATRVFRLDRPIRNVWFFNNNPKAMGGWHWERRDIHTFMVCYSNRGMITLPEMPQPGMKMIYPPLR